jgi:hypothetical protein
MQLQLSGYSLSRAISLGRTSGNVTHTHARHANSLRANKESHKQIQITAQHPDWWNKKVLLCEENEMGKKPIRQIQKLYLHSKTETELARNVTM